MIFYFSATGNSLYAAERLGMALDEKLINITDAVRKQEFKYQLAEGEKVGFIFPVYFYGLPTIVDDLVRKLKLEGGDRPYIFSVITCGEKIAGADKQFARKLAKSGYSINGSFFLPMTNNSVLWYELPSPEEQMIESAAADVKLQKIADVINKGGSGECSSGFTGSLKTAVMHYFYMHGRRTTKFYAEGTCTGCGLCERICPCNAIKMTDGRPKWVAEQCVQCLGCINRCPVAAIQYGSATKNRRRYVNPILK
jgi:NAD-dependent dihydropyrimidine dehydrogenase PreA subunit/flavodoxin